MGPVRTACCLALGALALSLAGCDLGNHEVVDAGPGDPTASAACSSTCHGSGGIAAPPRDLGGHTDTTSLGVGAHRAHVEGSTWHKRVECANCHVVPDQIGDPGHIDTDPPAELTFTGLGVNTTWDRNAETCSGSYCHGATLTNSDGAPGGGSGGSAGGEAMEPIWTVVDGSQIQCNSCHGAPPPAPHPDNADCGQCHPTMNPGGGMVIAYPELHIDGHVDVVNTAGCDSCHGGGGKSEPPKDTLGNIDTSFVGVGAHAAHMQTGTDLWHAPIDCVQCHQVPAGVNDQGHIDTGLPAEITWGPLAGDGAWDGARCSGTYCHGGGSSPLTGGSAMSPQWTRTDGTQSQCGSCHGAPPPSPHPSDSNCGSCHPTMTPGDNTTITYPALHINGTVDVTNDQPCDTCHGGGGNPAPPMDTTGGTTTDLRGVGAHANHMNASTWRRDIACTDCHKVPTATTSIGHIDSALPAELTFSPLAGSASWNGSTCSNTYCHGATLTGGTSNNPVWTVVNGVQGQCGSCHGTPPPAPHPSDTDCGKCHDTMTEGGGLVITDPSRHIDGNLDVNTDQPCNSCHGGTNNAPPQDIAGNTATTARGVGAHQQHLATTGRFKPVDCGDCHRVPGTVTAVGHIDSGLPAELTFSTRAGPTTAWNGSRCSNNYCHGATIGAGGTATAPLWTTVNGTQATCASCHGNPPPSHSTYANPTQCQNCHTDMSSPTAFSDPLKHVDGNLDVNTALPCNGACHGGANNAPPMDTTGANATTTRGVGAHQAHVAGDTSWHKAVTCAQCHTVPATVDAAGHQDTPRPAELTFTGLASGSSWNGSTCTSYCHGSTLAAGGSATSPQWTKVDGTQSQCASCHGNPPPSHAGYASPTQCSNCHADGGTGGTFTNAAQHIDGTLQVNAQHPPGYNAREQHGYDVDQHSTASCATAACHGTALTGGSSGGPSCNSCHTPNWRTTCNFCHGTGTDGAPPAGVMGATLPTDPHVGAHTKHLGATSMHGAWTCAKCHTTPTDALNPGHIDGTGGVVQAEVVYSTMNPGATFTASTAGCSSVYCHGSGLPSGGVAGAGTATWTSTTAMNCTTSCHGGDAARTGMSSEHRRSDHRKTCNRCHNTVSDATPNIINAGLHVNGTRDVSFSNGGTYNATAKSCTGTGSGCHGTGTQSGWH